jgi:hypothetical protein
MRFTCKLPDSAAACEIVLDALAKVVTGMVDAGVVPPYPHDVRKPDGSPGIVYRLEAPGEEDWKLPPEGIRDGWMDCEDLAIWVVGGLRSETTGPEDPGARVRIIRTARGKLHAVVLRSDGTYEDPSIDLMTPEDLERLTG